MNSAYEITNFHKREPPPKEILEDVSAKGGDLLNRTLENYYRPVSREAESLANGRDSDESDEEREKTPNEERMDVDEPGSTGRITRGKLLCNVGANAMRDSLCVHFVHNFAFHIMLVSLVPP